MVAGKLEEVEKEMEGLKGEYERRIAQREGEIVRLEKTIGEVRAAMSDRSNKSQRVQNNLNNEMQSMVDKI